MNLLWLQSAGCGGCTMSLLCAEDPNVFDLLDRDVEPVDQYRAELLLVGASLLNLQRLIEALFVNDLPF